MKNKPPETKAQALAERLLLLTLSLVDPAKSGLDFELPVIIAERAKILDQLEKIEIDPGARELLVRVSKVEEQVKNLLIAERDYSVGQLNIALQERKAASAYRSGPTRRSAGRIG